MLLAAFVSKETMVILACCDIDVKNYVEVGRIKTSE